MQLSKLRTFVAALLLLVLGGGTSASFAFEPLPRKILAFLDESEGETSEDNDIQLMLAMPLHHLGMQVRYHDYSGRRLPPLRSLQDHRGVIVWTHMLDCNDELRDWLLALHRQGKKILLLQSQEPEPPVLIPGECNEDDEKINRLYQPLGFLFSSLVTRDGVEGDIQVYQAHPRWYDFEMGFDKIRWFPYEFYRSVKSDVKADLKVWIDGIQNSESDMVLHGNFGGYAVIQYLWNYKLEKDFPHWLIDPLKYLEAVFGLETWPRPEANVVNGLRAYYSHVDGDAFNSYSYDRPSQICGEIFYEEILTHERFSHLPVTISLISAEVDERTKHVEKASIPTARRIYSLKNVEAASHAFTHPMDWRTGDLAFKDVVFDGVPYRFDRREETVRSLKKIEEFTPEGRPPKVMLWSGSCNPDAATLEILRQEGYVNMNGGDPRMDSTYDSLSQVAPPVWPVGEEIRLGSGAANDYLLTNEWTPPFTGFQNIIETFENTAKPRPLTPVNVYVHFYIVERDKAMASFKQVLNWVTKQDLIHLFASEYLEGVQDLIEAKMFRDGDRFRVESGGKLPTIRFDRSPLGGPIESLAVDMSQSKGVLGYGQLYDAFYVYLDESGEHEFLLTHQGQEEFRLIESNRPFDLLPKEGDQLVAFQASGFGTSHFRFAGFPPQSYASILKKGGPQDPIKKEVVQVDSAGHLRLDVRLGLGAEIRVETATQTDYELHVWWTWFVAKGRFYSLVAILALIGWILCRYSVPMMRTLSIVEVLPGDARVDGIELQPLKKIKDVGRMAAGGVGPWAREIGDDVDVVDHSTSRMDESVEASRSQAGLSVEIDREDLK